MFCVVSRRALRHGLASLGQAKPFFYKLVADLVKWRDTWWQKKLGERVAQVIKQEERFGETFGTV